MGRIHVGENAILVGDGDTVSRHINRGRQVFDLEGFLTELLGDFIKFSGSNFQQVFRSRACSRLSLELPF